MKYPPKSVGLKHLDWVALVLSTKLPHLSKSLVMYLSRFMNKEQDMAWPSQARIMAELSISKGALCTHLNTLEEEGWIIRERGDSKTNTRYLVCFPKKIEKVVHEVNYVVHEKDYGSPSDELGVVHEVNTNRQLNNPINRQTNNSAFLEFWENYPRKQDKKKAERAFNNLTEEKKRLAMKDCLLRYKDTDKRYIPLATTYIHGERWEDEIIKTPIEDKVKFPPRGNCDAWVSFASRYGINTKAGESLNEFEMRVRAYFEE